VQYECIEVAVPDGFECVILSLHEFKTYLKVREGIELKYTRVKREETILIEESDDSHH
jgi:hypothetical protein